MVFSFVPEKVPEKVQEKIRVPENVLQEWLGMDFLYNFLRIQEATEREINQAFERKHYTTSSHLFHMLYLFRKKIR